MDVEHESNGRDSLNSRSWNFISGAYTSYLSDNWTGTLKIWFPFGSLSDNPDLLDYIGPFQIDLSYKMSDKLIFDTEIRKALSLNEKGSLILAASYRISKTSNQFLYLQYYVGYAESLIDYNRDVNQLRIGIMFKDLFMRFRN